MIIRLSHWLSPWRIVATNLIVWGSVAGIAWALGTAWVLAVMLANLVIVGINTGLSILNLIHTQQQLDAAVAELAESDRILTSIRDQFIMQVQKAYKEERS